MHEQTARAYLILHWSQRQTDDNTDVLTTAFWDKSFDAYLLSKVRKSPFLVTMESKDFLPYCLQESRQS